MKGTLLITTLGHRDKLGLFWANQGLWSLLPQFPAIAQGPVYAFAAGGLATVVLLLDRSWEDLRLRVPRLGCRNLLKWPLTSLSVLRPRLACGEKALMDWGHLFSQTDLQQETT